MTDSLLRFLLAQSPLAVVLGVGLWEFAAGRWHSDAEYKQVRKDLETERAAHEQTRTALALASARADAGLRAAELVANAVEGTRHVPQTTQPD